MNHPAPTGLRLESLVNAVGSGGLRPHWLGDCAGKLITAFKPIGEAPSAEGRSVVRANHVKLLLLTSRLPKQCRVSHLRERPYKDMLQIRHYR
jgi:hypothetical protein